MPPGVVARDAASGSGMTVGWLLAIALGGGALLFVSLAFILVAITDRRTHKARLQAEHEASLVRNDGDESSTDFEGPERPRNRRRLTKSPQVTPSRRKRRSLPHILPQIRRNSSIMNLFGSPTSKGEKTKNPRSRRKNSWIDEDAIHGPEMQRRLSKRISLRESWLMMRTPTLPNLLGYRDEPDTESFYRHQNYPVAAPRPAVLPVEKQNPDSQPVSRMPLVRTPSYELAQQRAAALRFNGVAREEHDEEKGYQQGHYQQQNRRQRQGQWDQNEQEQQSPSKQQTTQDNVRYGPRPPPAAKLAKLRTVNTDSNLELILRNTASRLRDPSPVPAIQPSSSKEVSRPPQLQANRASRHRRTQASQESPIKGFRNDRPHSAAMKDAYRGVQKTPSPKKMPVQAMTTPQSAPAAMYEHQQGTPTRMSGTLMAQQQARLSQHKRNTSAASMVSDADSLFGETVPDAGEPLAAGLSSPSRRPSQNESSAPIEISQRRRSVSVPSMRSSVSSALSTVYSEEDPDQDRAMTMDQRIQTGHDNHADSRSRRPRYQGHVLKMSDPFLTVNAPDVPERSPRRLSAVTPDLGYPAQSANRHSQDAAILGQISGNAQNANNSPVLSSPILKDRDNVRMSILMGPQQSSGGRASMRPTSVVPMKPIFFASSTSVASMQADPSTPEDDKRAARPKTSHGGRRMSVVPPPLNLCPVETSQHEHQPSFNLQVQTYDRSQSMDSLPSSPPENRPLPDPELMSPTHAYLNRLGFFNDGSPVRANSNASARSSQYSETNHGPRDHYRAESPVHQNTTRVTPQAGSGTKRANSTRMSPLTASIVQLRRMNSQMSTYSAASSAATDMHSVVPESPTLPQLRGGGFSPDRSSSRMNKAGRQNYLNMGTPSPSPKSKRSGRGTKGADAEARAGHVRRSSIAEEKENGERIRDGAKKRQREEERTANLTRGGLKGSFRTAESPRRRLSVRFGDVEEHVFVGEHEAESSPPRDVETPERRHRGPEDRDPKRASADSLGLYDKDGFLMSSPDRLPSSAAEGATGRPRSGLRV